MFCVIQKIVNKKSDLYGHYKELTVSSTSFGFSGQPLKTKYSYTYGNERFERSIKDAYKISIHKSYRENGKVKKKQWVIGTWSYYMLADFGFDFSPWMHKDKMHEMDITANELEEMIWTKLEPFVEQINAEYKATDEYKTKVKHDEILNQYRIAKSKFEEIYGDDTYDYCYDIFGTLRNPEYLEEVKAQKKAQEEYFKRSHEQSYQSNYSNYNFGGYSVNSGSNYTDEEKVLLKKIYKTAAKYLHPDITKDDGKTMQFLTKLKEQWGI
jgi:hypothetical protein